MSTLQARLFIAVWLAVGAVQAAPAPQVGTPSALSDASAIPENVSSIQTASALTSTTQFTPQSSVPPSSSITRSEPIPVPSFSSTPLAVPASSSIEPLNPSTTNTVNTSMIDPIVPGPDGGTNTSSLESQYYSLIDDPELQFVSWSTRNEEETPLLYEPLNGTTLNGTRWGDNRTELWQDLEWSAVMDWFAYVCSNDPTLSAAARQGNSFTWAFNAWVITQCGGIVSQPDFCNLETAGQSCNLGGSPTGEGRDCILGYRVSRAITNLNSAFQVSYQLLQTQFNDLITTRADSVWNGLNTPYPVQGGLNIAGSVANIEIMVDGAFNWIRNKLVDARYFLQETQRDVYFATKAQLQEIAQAKSWANNWGVASAGIGMVSNIAFVANLYVTLSERAVPDFIRGAGVKTAIGQYQRDSVATFRENHQRTFYQNPFSPSGLYSELATGRWMLPTPHSVSSYPFENAYREMLLARYAMTIWKGAGIWFQWDRREVSETECRRRARYTTERSWWETLTGASRGEGTVGIFCWMHSRTQQWLSVRMVNVGGATLDGPYGG